MKNKTQYVLDKLEFQLFEELNKVAPYWDSLNEYEKSKIKFLGLIVKLGYRNKSLAKLLYLQNFYAFHKKSKSLEEFRPKRGKDNPGQFPLKLIMEVLACSHRQAQAYLLYFKGEDMANQMFASLQQAAKETTP